MMVVHKRPLQKHVDMNHFFRRKSKQLIKSEQPKLLRIFSLHIVSDSALKSPRMARIVNHNQQYEPLDFTRLTLPRRRNQMLSPLTRTPKFPLPLEKKPSSPSPLPNISFLNLETTKLIPPLHPLHPDPYDKTLRPASKAGENFPDKINELNSLSATTVIPNVWLPKISSSSDTFQREYEQPNKNLVMNNIKPINWALPGNNDIFGNQRSGHVMFSSLSNSKISDSRVSRSPMTPVFPNLPGIQEGRTQAPEKMLNNKPNVSVGCDMQDNFLEAIMAEAKLKAELSAKNSSFRNSLPPFFDHQPLPLHHSTMRNVATSIHNDRVGLKNSEE